MNNKHFVLEADQQWIVLPPGNVRRCIKAYDDQIMMVEVVFEKGAVGEVHAHPHSQVTYVLEGEFDFTVSEEMVRVKVADSIYIPPDSRHGCHLVSERGRLLDVFSPCRKDFL